MITVANSGAEEPAAMKVAPATSGDSLNSEKENIIKSNEPENEFECIRKNRDAIFYRKRKRRLLS